LVAAVVETGITKKQAAGAVDAFTNAITGTLKKGDKVSLVGYYPAMIVELALLLCVVIEAAPRRFITTT
jgi:hypothetical protein